MVVLSDEVSATGVTLRKIISLFPLVKVVLLVSIVEFRVMVISPTAHFHVAKPDSPRESSQVCHLNPVRAQQTQHLGSLFVVDSQDFLLDLTGVVATVGYGAGVVAGVEPVAHKHSQ